jgi:hypothetical protein
MRGRRRIVIAAVVATGVAVLVAVAHDAVAGAGIRAVVAAFGYDLSSKQLRLGSSTLSIVAPVLCNRAVFTYVRKFP